MAEEKHKNTAARVLSLSFLKHSNVKAKENSKETKRSITDCLKVIKQPIKLAVKNEKPISAKGLFILFSPFAVCF